MRIRNRVWTAPDGSSGSDEASDEGFEEKEEGRFLMPLLAAALEAERDFEAKNEIIALQKKKISTNVRGNGWRDLLLSWKDSDKANEARFKEWEIQSREMRSLRYGIANPGKEKEIGASTLHSVVSTLTTSSRHEHDLFPICQRRCSAKQKPNQDSASNSKRDVTGSRTRSIDYQRSKKRKENTSDSTEKKKPKVREIEIAETDTRCKRRNGKGWRCSGTKVRGYCLCEHHLSRTQAQPSKNKKTATVKENVFDAGSGSHGPPAVNGVDNSAQEYAGEYEQKKTNRMEVEMQVKKQLKKKKSLKDINSVLDHHPHRNHHHPHLISDFTFELRE